MRRHVIIGRYGPGDRSRLPLGDGEVETRLDLVAGERSLDHGIGRALGDLARLGVYPSEMGFDVLVLATHVHAADTRVSRSSESQDGWTRELRLVVPVSDPDRWTAVAPTFVRMLDPAASRGSRQYHQAGSSAIPSTTWRSFPAVSTA
jgi:hypothetical protein